MVPISATGTRICASIRGLLRPELGQRYRLVYDRAALIALPGAMRRQYAALMSRLVEAGGQVLLVTLEYQPEQQLQPPFSVGRWRCAPCLSATLCRGAGPGAELQVPGCSRGSSPISTRWFYRLIRRG